MSKSKVTPGRDPAAAKRTQPAHPQAEKPRRHREQEQQQLARQLETEKSRLVLVQAVAKIGSWEMDLATMAIAWSEETHRIFETNPATFAPTRETFLDLVHPDDRTALREALALSLNETSARTIEHRVVLPDGRRKVVEERWQVFRDEHDRPVRVIGICRDISERRQAEESLREQALLLANAQRIGRMGSWSLDLRSGRLVWPKATCDLFGITPAEFTGTFEHFHRFILAEDLPAYDAAHTRVSPGAPLLEAEYRIRRSDGEVRWMYERGTVEFDASGTAISRVGMVMDITEQRAAREQLAQNAALLRIAGRVAHLGGWTIDLADRTLTWSDENCLIHDVSPGYKPTLDEGIGYFPPECRAEVIRCVEECAKNGTPYDFELPKNTAKGRRIWVRSIGEAVRDAEGRIIRLQGAFQDISDRKEEEEKTRELTARLSTTLESLTDGFFTLDRDWRFTYVNREAERMLRIPRAELLGRNIWEKFPAARDTLSHQEYARALRDNVSVQFETAYPPFDAWFDVRAYPSVQGLAVYFHDVGEQRKAREEVRVSEERFRLLSKATHDAIWDWNLSTNTLWWNEGYERLFGYRPEETDPTLKSWTDYLHPDDAARVMNGLRQALDHGDESWSDEFRFRRKDGSYAYVLDRGHIIRDAAGKPIRMIGGKTDMSERMRAEEETRRAGETLAGIVAALQKVATAHFNLQDVMDFIAAQAQALTGATGGVVELVEHQEMVCRAASGAAAGNIGLHFPRDRSLSGLAVQGGAPLVCGDIKTDERADCVAGRNLGVCSMLVAPLRDNQRVIGVLKVTSDQPRAFVQRDVNNLQILVESLGAVIQRQRATEQLRASEEQYRLLFASNPHPMWVFDLETLRFLAVNEAAVKHYGYTVEEFLAMTVLDIRAAEDATTLQDALAHLPEKGTARGFRRHQKKGGEIIDVEASSDNVVLNGRPARLVLAHDVTEQMRAEREAARASRALQMLSRCNEALIHAESERALLAEICRIAVETGGFRMAWIGYAGEDAGRPIVPQAHAGVEEDYLADIKLSWSEAEPSGRGPAGQVIRRGQPVVIRDMAHDETFRAWREAANARGYRGVIVLPLKDRTRTFGLLALIMPQVRDVPSDELHLLQELADNLAFGITNLRARAEQRLAQQVLAQQAALLDKAQDAILVCDLEHHLTYWNKSAQRLYGWSAAEANGRSVRELIHRDGAAFDAAMQKTLQRGEWMGEFTQFSKDGRELAIEARWTLVGDEASRPRSVLAINTDITERKQLEAQFLRAQRMESIGTLAGGIAHDLNNMLSPIIMGVELLKQFEPGAPSQRVIASIERSARRGADLVKQVLSFARGVEGARVAVHLGHMVREIQLFVQDTFPKNITSETLVPPDLWLVMGDPTQLNQVLLNLCVNARDAMPAGGRLVLSVKNITLDEPDVVMHRGVSAGRYVLLEVTDTGCGMPREIIDRIFEPFFTTKELDQGTGLGLSTALGITRSHGGFVEVRSAVGKGSTLQVYLPAQAADGAITREAGTETGSFPRGRGELILLVDDEIPVLNITKHTLEAFGYRAITAEDGAQAISLYARQRNDIAVVLTDMMMPVMDGPALIAALQRINPQVCITAASGLNASGPAAGAANAGVKHFLAKPYSVEAMLALLKKVLAAETGQAPQDHRGRYGSRFPFM